MDGNQSRPGLMRTLAQIGAAAGALTAIVTLVFLMFPRFKPQEPVQRSGVTVDHVQVNPRELGDYIIVRFSAHVQGYKDETLPVMWMLYDVDTGKPVTNWRPDRPIPLGPVENRHKAVPTSQFKPSVQDETLLGDVRIEKPHGYEGRRWKCRIEVTDPNGNTLGQAESEPFVGTR